MRGDLIKQKLIKGERVYGTHIVSYGNPIATKMICDANLDFVFICTEHMPLDRTEVSQMCLTYASSGISPIVRIPYPSARLAGMFIDGGAQGIVAPYVETVEEVKELVGAIKYRPIKGKFLRDILDGNREPSEKLKEFWTRFNKDLYLIIGIESMEAINNLEELISVDGVSGVFLGPHDITCSMEIPEEYDNPKFIDVVVNIIKKCREKGVGVGIHYDQTSKMCKPYLEAGANFLLNSADVVKMKQIIDNDRQFINKTFTE